ncbi:hypothetical protein HUJ04_005561 [Dendroctonus ponderosae]|nr:hypothetical protein HUJ04_005561 [Dendroctonus ponderosae]
MAFTRELKEAQASLRGKITERRKALETLIALLKNEEVIACIDEDNHITFISYIEACLRDRTMRCCKDTFLRMIKDYILSSKDCLGALEPEDFILRTELNQTSSESKNLIVFSSFALLVRFGPLVAFPANFLRDQFAFVAKLGQSVTLNDSRILQEDAIDIVLHFCQHVKLIEFFLLQLVLHNPNGVLENDSQALANKWTTWKSCIIKIYHLLLAEIHQYLRQPVKNTQFFTCTEDNTVIKDSFALLFVETCNQLFSYTELPAYLCEDFQPEKRKRIEVSLETFIAKIQDTNSWVWVKLVGALLQKYPQLIDRALFFQLLQVLHTKQLEVRDNNTIRCIYEMQAVLLDIEERLEASNQKETFNLWTLVGDSTLRAVGLNHHIKETQHLLRKLICRQIIKVESVIQTYTSGVLITTEHHLATLQLVLEFTNPSQLPLSRKEELVNSLLNVPNIKNFRCLLKRNFAEVLVGLTLKHCPDYEREEASAQDGSMCVYGTLAALFAKSTFNLEQILIRAPALKAPTKRSFNTDSAALEILLKKLNAFVDSVYSESTDKLFCAVGLLYNVASCMIDYQVLQEDQLQTSTVLSLINRVLSNESTQSFQRFQVHSGSALKQLQAIALILDDVFSIKNSVTQQVKELFSFNFLKEILQVLQFFQEDSPKKADTAHKVKKLLVGALSKYCLVSNSVETAEHQPHIAEILADQDYDFKNDSHCEMSVVFLQNVKLAPPGVLSEDIIRKILECLQGLCRATYRHHESAVTILNILAGLFQHLQHASADLKSAAVNVLYTFYLRQSYYGPDVLIALLDAIEELCTMDVDCCSSQWDGNPVIKHVPDFLSSNFQRVRYRAVALLVNYLKISAGTTRLSTIHLSEELFSLIYERNSQVFEVTDSLSEERLQEEIAGRASSALYTFLAIIVNCNNWIEESVLAIIRLEHSKGLGRLFNGGNI